MKLVDVTLTLFAWKGLPDTHYGSRAAVSGGSSQLGLLELKTDDGLIGHSFLGSAQRGADLDGDSLIRVLKPLILGKDPLRREYINQQMMQRSRSTTMRAIGAVDVALWDLAGKVAGLPICRLMGLNRERIPAYASSAVLTSSTEYAEEALELQENGWLGYKIHPPTVKHREDIAICEEVREAVGDEFSLMLDSMWSYDYFRAVTVGKAIESLGFEWFEDPLAEDDLLGYVALKRHLAIPLHATEQSPGGFTAYAPWVVHQATDSLRADVAVKGGITAVMKVAHLAEAFHMSLGIHHGGNSLNNVANLHVALSVANCDLFEVLLPNEVQSYGLHDEPRPIDGHFNAPTAPGLGATIDFDLVARHALGVLS